MRFRFLLILPLLALAACDLFRATPGEFVGSISGNVTEELNGEALFGDGRGLYFGWGGGWINIDTNDFFEVEPGRYVAGQYVLAQRPAPELRPRPLAADTFAAVLNLGGIKTPTRSFLADPGVLVIDSVSASEIWGALSFSALEWRDSTQVVEVSGRFRAEYVPFTY